jgi:hypothetical protein
VALPSWKLPELLPSLSVALSSEVSDKTAPFADEALASAAYAGITPDTTIESDKRNASAFFAIFFIIFPLQCH